MRDTGQLGDYHKVRAVAAGASQSESALPPEGSLDAGFARGTRDVPADAAVERGLPGHQSESQPVVDHSVTPTGEIGRADEHSADMLAGLDRKNVRPPSFHAAMALLRSYGL
jgi:hypothetical protein